MSRVDLSTHDLFLRLGATPLSRRARADKLFRQLRAEEEESIVGALTKAPGAVKIAPKKAKPKKG